MDGDLLNKYNLKNFTYRMNWEITRKCNFSCSYCVNKQGFNEFETPVFSPEEIAGFFKNTSKEWLILITGGEPFTYPNFAEVCQKLAENHYLQITSNLSLPEVYDFADIVNPQKVFMLSASFHSLERKEKAAREEFFNKCNYLKNKGFNVVVNYITHPDSMDKMEEEIACINNKGFETFAIILRGMVGEKSYPEAFSENDMKIIKPHVIDFDIETKAAFGKLNYYGHKCEAGSKYFFVKPNGDVSRCATLQKKIGNLFDGTIVSDKQELPCIANNCNDVYCGLASVLPQKANRFRINKEKKKYNNL
ncbi:MAG TPA: radical SAM protein [Bacteroidales bacterium]|nr:radical SAM protein [Bacteroidales bacterium]